MFKSKRIKDLEESRIGILENLWLIKQRLEKIENQNFIIGEFFGGYFEYRKWSVIKHWQKFTIKDITDELENKVKIFGMWVKKEDIIHYEFKYDKQRKTIESRYKTIDKKK